MGNIDLSLLNDCFKITYQYNCLKKEVRILKQQDKNNKIDNTLEVKKINAEIDAINEKYEVALSQIWEQILIRTNEFVKFLKGKFNLKDSECSDTIADGITKLISRVGENPLNFADENTFIDFFKINKLQNIVNDSFTKSKKKPAEIDFSLNESENNYDIDYGDDGTRSEFKRSIEEIADIGSYKEVNEFEKVNQLEVLHDCLGIYALRVIDDVAQKGRNNKGARSLRKKIAWQYGVNYEVKLHAKMNELAYEDLSDVSPIYEIHRYKAWNKIDK